MKKINHRLVLVLTFSIIVVGCTKEDDNPLIPIVENKALAVKDEATLMFKCLTGSQEGGIDGLEEERYKALHHDKMNQLLSYDHLVEKSSILFIGDTDSLVVNGYLNCSFFNYYGTILNLVAAVTEKTYKYRFDNEALKILFDNTNDKENWLTLGYGNKEKLEVYIETVNFSVARMIADRNDTTNWDDKYVWEHMGTFGFTSHESLEPKVAENKVQDQDWQAFFNNVGDNWKYIPAGKYFAEVFKSKNDVKFKPEGVTWSINKITYLPVEKE